MLYDNLLKLIDKGQEGNYPWVPFQHQKMGSHVGIGKRLYHLIGGDPGSGKTSFVDQSYVLDPYEWYKYRKPEDDDTKFKVIYFSMERSKEYKLAKWVAMRLWQKEGIIVDVPTVLGWGTAKRKLTDFERNKISQYREYYEEMFKDVKILDGANNPTGVYKQLMDWALLKGEVYRRDKHGDLYRKDRKKFLDGDKDVWEKIGERALPDNVELSRYEDTYVPNNPHLITQYIIDHLGTVRNERGLGDKGTLDKTSEYNRIFRDFFGFCPIMINQFNRNNADIRRRVNTDMTPERQDFKGSGNMFEDADVAPAIFNPYNFGISEHLGYKIKKMKTDKGFNRFRSVTILKNTYGVANIGFGFQFIGECGFYREIPRASRMTDEIYEQVAYPRETMN